MIEEIKALMDILGKLPDMALHGFIAYGIYKIIIYLATTGSIAYIAKLLITRLFDYLDKGYEHDKIIINAYKEQEKKK